MVMFSEEEEWIDEEEVSIDLCDFNFDVSVGVIVVVIWVMVIDFVDCY